jgi:tetratricopeptide (TPR) repeat protein
VRPLAVDANNSQALAGLALCYATDFQLGWPAAEVDYDSKVLGLAHRALTLDRENTLAHLAKAGYLNGRDRQIDALRIVDEGLAIDPNSAPLLVSRSILGSYLGQFEQAKTDIQTAMRLSPRDPSLSRWRNFLSDAELETSSKAIDGGYRVYFSYLNLAAAHALKGNTEEAKKALAQARQVYPKLSVNWLPFSSTHSTACAKQDFRRSEGSLKECGSRRGRPNGQLTSCCAAARNSSSVGNFSRPANPSFAPSILTQRTMPSRSTRNWPMS